MSIIIPANSAAASGGYEITNSCRFNPGDSPKMVKASSSAGNGYKGTFSLWVKRSNLGAQQMIGQQDTGHARVFFNGANQLRCYGNTAAENNAFDLASTALFRDVGAWYHIVFAWDNTQSTASNRNKVYVNGVQLTDFATETYNPQNTQIGGGFFVNSTNLTISGKTADYFNGYMTEIVGIENTTYGPTDFGEFDEDSGIWKPIDGLEDLTFGTNGFYLDFEDSANLGNDVNGGTDFTESNLAAIDQTTDTCTNNFATLNSLANVIAPVTLTEGNLKIAMTNSKGGNLSTISCTDGKYYAEMKITTAPQDFRFHWGIMPHPVIAADDPINAANAGIMLSGYNAVIYAANGIINNFYGNATGRFSGNPILGLAIDLKSATRTIAISINGAWVTGSNATDTDFSNALKVDITSYVATYPNWFIGCGSGNGSGTTGVYELNFGNPIFTGTDQADGNGYGSFEYPPPSGYLALCTKNLSGELS
jgi:hypothetical protein